MKSDNSPVEYTCPKINQVIRFLKSIAWDENDKDEKDFCDECQDILNIMEEIRQDNEKLRQWGNDEYKHREKLGSCPKRVAM